MAENLTLDRSTLSFPELVAWAWSETAPVHKSPVNLLIHLFAVPLFVFGHALLFVGIFSDHRLLVIGPVVSIVAFLFQGIGHKLERQPSIPFQGPRDVVRRIYAEQFINYWRFFFSGAWFTSLLASLKRD